MTECETEWRPHALNEHPERQKGPHLLRVTDAKVKVKALP